MTVLTEISFKVGEATRGRRVGVMACAVGLLVWAQMAGAGPQGTAVDDGRREHVPASESKGWIVEYRFVGLPQEGVYQELEVGPDGEEVPCPDQVILVTVVRVSLGEPPVDKNGLFRYRSLFATKELQQYPLGPLGPWRGLEFEFTCLSRRDPLTGKTMYRVDAKPYWWWLVGRCLLGGGLVLAVTAAGMLVRRAVRRRLRR